MRPSPSTVYIIRENYLPNMTRLERIPRVSLLHRLTRTTKQGIFAQLLGARFVSCFGRRRGKVCWLDVRGNYTLFFWFSVISCCCYCCYYCCCYCYFNSQYYAFSKGYSLSDITFDFPFSFFYANPHLSYSLISSKNTQLRKDPSRYKSISLPVINSYDLSLQVRDLAESPCTESRMKG